MMDSEEVPAPPPAFEWVEPLGSGGEGLVMLARGREAGELRAIKLARAHQDEDSRERLLKEFRILVQLRHPCLVQAQDYGSLPDGTPYLVYEYLAGGSLERRRLPAARARVDRWAGDLLSGLGFLHSEGFLHLDLKLSNLLLKAGVDGGPERLILADFGLCARVGGRHRRSGTPGFMAPEISSGFVATQRADLYSVGAILYEVLTGSPAFRGDSPVERHQAQLSGSWDRECLRRVAPDLLPILERLLSLTPELRFAGVRDVLSRVPRWRIGESLHGSSGIPLGREDLLAEVLASLESGARHIELAGDPGSGRTSFLRALYGRLRARGRPAHEVCGEPPASFGPGAVLLVDDPPAGDLASWTAAAERSGSACLVTALANGDSMSGNGGTRFCLGPILRAEFHELLARHLPGHGRTDLENYLYRLCRGLPGLLPGVLESLLLRGVLHEEGGRWVVDTAAVLRGSQDLDTPRPRGGDPLEASRCLEAAAAMTAGSEAQAERLRRALWLLPDGPDRTLQLEALAGMAGAHEGSSLEEQVVQECLGDPGCTLERWDLLRRLGWCRLIRGGLPAEARVPLEEAFRESHGDPMRKARVLADLAWLQLTDGQRERAEDTLRDGASLLPREPSRTLALIRNRMGGCRYRAGDLLAASEAYRETLAIALQVGDRAMETKARSNLLHAEIQRGRFAELLLRVEEWRAGPESREALSSPEFRNLVPLYCSALSVSMRFADCARETLAALSDLEQEQDQVSRAAHHVSLIISYIQVGQLDRADVLLQRSLPLFRSEHPAYQHSLTSEILGARGDHLGALREGLRAFRMRRRAGLHSEAAVSLWYLVEHAILQEEASRFRPLRHMLQRQLELPGLRPRSVCMLQLARLSLDLAGARIEGVEGQFAELRLGLAGVQCPDLEFRFALLETEWQWRSGRVDEAWKSLARAEERTSPDQSPIHATRCLLWKARLLLLEGRGPEAEAQLLDACERFRLLQCLPEERIALRLLAEVRRGASGDPASGGTLATDLLELLKCLDDPGTLLDRAVSMLLAHIPAERCVVLLRGPDGATLRPVAGRETSPELEKMAIQVSEGVLRNVLRTGDTLFHEDLTSDPDLGSRESVRELGIRSVLCQALRGNHGILGAVYLDHRAAIAGFGMEHRKLLGVITRVIAAALEQAEARAELRRRSEILDSEAQDLRLAVRHATLTDRLVMGSPQMRRVVSQVDQLARLEAPVLLLGPSGVGKDRLARRMHALSPRHAGPWVDCNCSTLSETMGPAEIFGVERGAATGVEARPGLFERADGGTLFLDEVAEMPLPVQAQMLRILQEQEVTRVGGRKPLRVNTRLIFATNAELERLVREGRFRGDLYFRISAHQIEVPPLRKRREDILPMAEYFLSEFRRVNPGHVARSLSRDFRDWLLRQEWPGNCRELRNSVERAAVRSEGPEIEPEAERRQLSERASESRQKEWERRHHDLLLVLERSDWNQSAAAQELGKSEHWVRYWMKRLKIQRPLRN